MNAILDIEAIGREHLPKRRFSMSFNTRILGVDYAGQVGFYPDGRPGEVFFGMEKAAGTVVDVNARDLSVLISIALQRGATIDELLKSVTRDENGKVEGLAGHVLLELQDIAEQVQATPGEEAVPLQMEAADADLLVVREESVAAIISAFDLGQSARRREEARTRGYTGDQCVACQNFTMVRNGTCLKCETCGETTGCS